MRHLIQILKEDNFEKDFIAPEQCIEKSSFSEAINSRGLEQMELTYKALCKQAERLFANKIISSPSCVNTILKHNHQNKCFLY